MKKLLTSALVSAALYAPVVLSADEVKIGFITTLTTGAASIGPVSYTHLTLPTKRIV